MNSPISPDVLLTGMRLLGWRTNTEAERERLAGDVRLLLELQALTAEHCAEWHSCQDAPVTQPASDFTS